MQADVFTNARGETIMKYEVFKELRIKPDQLVKDLSKLPASKSLSRRERRIRNGKIKG